MSRLLAAVVLGLCVLAGSAPAAPPPEVEALIKQLSDKDEAVRLKAAKELGKLKGKAKDAIPALKKASTDDADEDVRAVATKALAAVQEVGGKGDEPKVDEGVAAIIKDLKSKDNKTKLAAIAKLEAMGEKAKPAGAALVEYGMMSANAKVRDAATTAFEKIDPKVHTEVVTILVDEDVQKRGTAVAALAAMGSDAKAGVPAIKWLHQLFFNANKQAPALTVDALVEIAPDDPAVKKMILELVGGADEVLPGWSTGVILLRGRSPRKRIIAHLKKVEIEDKQKVAALVAGIGNSGIPEDEEVLVATLGGLDIDGKEKCAALLKGLAKAHTQRAQVVEQIGKLGADAKDALPTLKALKTDKDQAVREAATAALDAIK